MKILTSMVNRPTIVLLMILALSPLHGFAADVRGEWNARHILTHPRRPYHRRSLVADSGGNVDLARCNPATPQCDESVETAPRRIDESPAQET